MEAVTQLVLAGVRTVLGDPIRPKDWKHNRLAPRIGKYRGDVENIPIHVLIATLVPDRIPAPEPPQLCVIVSMPYLSPDAVLSLRVSAPGVRRESRTLTRLQTAFRVSRAPRAR